MPNLNSIFIDQVIGRIKTGESLTNSLKPKCTIPDPKDYMGIRLRVADALAQSGPRCRVTDWISASSGCKDANALLELAQEFVVLDVKFN